jgi:hypothetical protein
MQEVTTQPKAKRSFFSKTKLYLFEYTAMQVANFWVGLSISISVFLGFALLNGKDISVSTVQDLAWVFGLILVFFPISVVLYARTTGEEIANKARVDQVFRKIVFFFMLAVATVSAVGFLSATIYSLVRTLFGLEEVSSLLTVSAPSAIVLLFHIYFLSLVLKKDPVSAKVRKLNIIVISTLGFLLGALVLSLALVKGDGASNDRTRVRDLSKASSEINNYYRDNSALPKSINDLKNGINSTLANKFESGQYTYKINSSNGDYNQPVPMEDNWDSSINSTEPSIGVLPPTNNMYQLCATFETTQSGGGYYYGDNLSSSDIPYYSQDFSYHPKGYHCFDLSAY